MLASYGRARHPTFDVVTFQKGMYIGAPFGHDVRAAADGKVVYADWFKGLGRLLLVDHGDHVMTLYGHTSAIVVRQGDRVQAQQVVAKVGDSSALGNLHYTLLSDIKPRLKIRCNGCGSGLCA